MYSFLQVMQSLAIWLIQLVHPFLGPICFVLAWGILLLLGLNLWSFTRDGIARARQMHRIPCADCQYFTNNPLLKCPIHPSDALSEAAIDCPDFEADTLMPHTHP